MSDQPGGMPPPAAPPPPPTDYTPGLPQPEYPVRLDVDHQPAYARFMPLVKWLLLLPHYLVLAVLLAAALVVALASWVATVITGRYPAGMFRFLVGVGRWNANVSAYLFLMTDRYPPFALEQISGHPVEFEVAYPEDGRVARWRPIIQWLLAIPMWIIVNYVLSLIASLCWIVAFFAILFTKEIPDGIFDAILVYLRWNARVTAYTLWMTPKYPPFQWA